MHEPVKFIADVMLGRLAKQLRLRGFDVLYDNTLDDNGVIGRALSEHRVILTRDHGLAARPLAENHIFVQSDRVEEQIAQVLASCPHNETPLTRCSKCNTPLSPVVKATVVDFIPGHIYDEHQFFLRCSACGRVYWRGSHVQRMEKAGIIKKKPGSTGTGLSDTMHQMK